MPMKTMLRNLYVQWRKKLGLTGSPLFFSAFNANTRAKCHELIGQQETYQENKHYFLPNIKKKKIVQVYLEEAIDAHLKEEFVVREESLLLNEQARDVDRI